MPHSQGHAGRSNWLDGRTARLGLTYYNNVGVLDETSDLAELLVGGTAVNRSRATNAVFQRLDVVLDVELKGV